MTTRIETPRLVLRQWNDADVEAWADMNADPRVMEFFPGVMARERSYEQAKTLRSALDKNRYGWFVMERKAQPGFAGIMAVDDIRHDLPFRPLREIGWRFPVESWGHGYATEAAQALMQFAREKLHWTEVVAITAAINLRSRRVMERLGMTYDPGEDFDHPRVPDGMAIKRHVLYRARL